MPRGDLVTDGLAEITRLRHPILLAESKIHHIPEFTFFSLQHFLHSLLA